MLPADGLASIPHRTFNVSPQSVLRAGLTAAVDAAPLTLHLDGVYEGGEVRYRFLVRQNPWSAFDPLGLFDPGALSKDLVMQGIQAWQAAPPNPYAKGIAAAIVGGGVAVGVGYAILNSEPGKGGCGGQFYTSPGSVNCLTGNSAVPLGPPRFSQEITRILNLEPSRGFEHNTGVIYEGEYRDHEGNIRARDGQIVVNKNGVRSYAYEEDRRERSAAKAETRRNANGGVDFAGHPDLYPVGPEQKNIVKIEYTGSRRKDYEAANQAAGFGKTSKPPKDYTWHHLDDYNAATNTGTMQLIKRDTHEETYPHNGGVRQYEKATGEDYK